MIRTKEELKALFAAGEIQTEQMMIDLIDSCFNNGRHEIGVFAALQGEAVTSIGTINQYEYIRGTFSNTPMEEFSFVEIDGEPYIKYIGEEPYYFEIDAHSTLKASVNGTTVCGAIKKNGTIVDESVMSVYIKTGGEPFNFSGTSVVMLETDDTIQMVTKADKVSNITFINLTATIRPFIDVTA